MIGFCGCCIFATETKKAGRSRTQLGDAPNVAGDMILKGLVESFVLTGNLQVVVVAIYIGDAFALETWQTLRMEHQLLKGMEDTLLGRFNVDDGTQLVLLDNLVVFGFATSYNDNTFGHGKEGIHGWRIAVELVENDIGIVHHQLVFGIRHGVCCAQFYTVGITLNDGLCSTQHDVSPLVGTALAVDADEQAQTWMRRDRGWRLAYDGQGDEMGLGRIVQLVARHILVETCYDGVAVVGNMSGEFFVRGIHPDVKEILRGSIGAHHIAEVMVTIAQRFLFDAGSCPYRVLAKGSENHLAVVASQKAVDRKQAFGTQVEADGIDELHHIIACESWKDARPEVE